MAFTDLSTTTQELLTQQFVFISKSGILLTLLVFSLLTIFYIKPKKTALLGTKLIRGIGYYTSWVYVISTPLQFFLLAPTVALDVVVMLLLAFYSVVFVIMMIIFLTNIIFHGTYFLTDLVTGENNYSQVEKEVLRPFK